MGEKKVDNNFKRGMTFTQKKSTATTPSNTVRNKNNHNYPYSFLEKNYKQKSLGSRFSEKIQTAISGTNHTVTTDKNKVIHRKLISNPLPFQVNTPAPAATKRIATRSTTDQPCCSKTTPDQQLNRRKDPPGMDGEKKKTTTRNENRQFTSPKKTARRHRFKS